MCSHAALPHLPGYNRAAPQVAAEPVSNCLSHLPAAGTQVSVGPQRNLYESCRMHSTEQVLGWLSSNATSSSTETSNRFDQDVDMLQEEAPSTVDAKQTAAALAQQPLSKPSEEQQGSLLADVERMKQLLLAAATPAAAAAAASCTPQQQQAALMQLGHLLLQLHTRATASKQQQARPAEAPSAGCKRPAEETVVAQSAAPAELSCKAPKVDQKLGPHSIAAKQQKPAAPAPQQPSDKAAAAAEASTAVRNGTAAALQRVTQEQQYELLLRASAAANAAGAAAAAGAARAATSNGSRPVLPVRQLPLGMQVSYLQSAGLLVPLDALAAMRQHQQQQQQQVLQQLRQQYQQQQLQQLQQQGLLVYGGGDIAGTGNLAADKGIKSSKSSKSKGKGGTKKDAAWHYGKTLTGPSAKVAKPAPPRVFAVFTGTDGAMAGWPDRTYMPGSDRDRVWQEHKLVMRVVEAALQGRPQALAAVKEANGIFSGRSCTHCWQARPINGQWCCTKPTCYKAAAAAAGVFREEELMLSNWEKVQEVDRRVRDEAAASATAADSAAGADAAEDATGAGEDAAATEAAAALAALAGSSRGSDAAEEMAGDDFVLQDNSQAAAIGKHHKAVQQQQQQQQRGSSGSPGCSSPGAAGDGGDSNTAAAGGSRQAKTATAPTPAAAAGTATAVPPAGSALSAAAGTAASSGLGAAAVAAAAAAPGSWPAAGPIVNWVPPTKEYSNTNADMQRLWREHQLNVKVLAVVLQEQPEALVLLQRLVDLLFNRPCVRCFSEGEGKAKCGSGTWLCGTCNRMFGRLHAVTDEGALWALANHVSVDPLYSLEAVQQHRQQLQQPRGW